MRKLVQTTCTRLAVLSASLLGSALVATAAAATGPVTNGDFGTGDLSGWTTFVTAAGNAGAGLPTVASFDVTGSGASNAAEFDVGHTSSSPGTDPEGGGLYQTVTSGSGSYILSADIASNNPAFGQNGSCGLFELMLDGNVVASHDFGACPGDATQRFSLASPDVGLPAGAHEVRVLITRPYGEDPGSPHEYVDNVALTLVSSLPTPSLPTAKQQCTNGGWKAFSGFKNQGDCVSYVATGGRNQPAN